MRLLFASSSGSGHYLPLVPWIHAAMARGHEVVVFGPESLRRSVGELPFIAGMDADPGAMGPFWASLHAMSHEDAEAAVIRELFIRHNSGALLDDARAAVRDFRPDVVLREPLEGGSAIAAKEAGVPQLRVAFGLAVGEERRLPHMREPLEELGPGTTDVVAASPYLTRWPATLDPAPFEVLRYREPYDAPDPLAAEWGDPGQPLVYVTFGTEAPKMGGIADIYPHALEAVADLPARVLLTVGRELDIEALGPVPDHVRVAPWADQRAVLAEAAVVLHHGGSGTTLGALEAGCPQVVFPLFADQPDNAAVVGDAGLGLALLDQERAPRRHPSTADVALLHEAILGVIRDAPCRERAEQVAAELAELPTLDEAAAKVIPGW